MKGYLRAKENWARSHSSHAWKRSVKVYPRLKRMKGFTEWMDEPGITVSGFPQPIAKNGDAHVFPLCAHDIFFPVENIQRMLLENSDGLGLYSTSMTNHSTLNCRNVLIEMIQMDFQSFLSIPGRRSETRKPLYLSTKSTGESCNYRSILNDTHGFAPKM